ncbi:nuclear transport factor 2 family protein [Phaeacidiphilus oryzae]|uniref:nuclear transport factor 2 family protein n=1 Tax=Phaeacidiphilus oryzae TaxID=348818 RepID=UPI00056C967E|nr:nuclear transport factor 2 family protein [Phaeacidiphilus oryzae]
MTAAENARAAAVPAWVLGFMSAIDTLDFEPGFEVLTEDTVMHFGTERVDGRRAIQDFFVRIDEPLEISHRVLEYWVADGGVRLLRGEATMARKDAPERVVSAPFIHIFYLADEEPVRVREIRITAGPLETDAVM